MAIVDLRQLNSRQIDPLLAEEARHWKQELQWDYRSSVELIKKFVDAKSLAGCAALEGGRAAGYAFYVLEEHKGLLGGLYISPQFPQRELAEKLLETTIETLRAIPLVERVEAQLIPFGCNFDEPLAGRGFQLYPRQFMLLDLQHGSLPKAEEPGPVQAAAGAVSGLKLERWNDRHFGACARLIQLAYANHMDGEINDQYRTESGALKFLKNIIMLPGCGQFQEHASFVLRAPRHPGTSRRGAHVGGLRRRRPYHTDLRHARLPGTRAWPATHGGDPGGITRAQFHRALAHGYLREQTRRATL